ncbi:putative endoribonuclease MazF [Sphingomonas sp. EC-HK361]|uniref:type II toxin-antitoxin system PemK/MazF family toxin n=1 Tax=Sphingomonas sp. EC-HK361 TaxID=2038397 RepID=UPI001253D719|nr:type II toxin-antitoxin system PemK/MazF family toxin [Sphingomonas sp. EC-HK361]VVT04177.1 putative endoribonuclease MazF [Sphingomonas sp. EC-HK361]
MIVLAAGPGDYSAKPRPFLVVQSDLFNASHGSFTLCPITSIVTGNALFRIAFAPEPGTGLREESEVQIDKVQSLRRARIVRAIGRASPTAMEQVDQALRRWLTL